MIPASIYFLFLHCGWCETRTACLLCVFQQFWDQSLTEVFWQADRYLRRFLFIQLLFIDWNKSLSKRLFWQMENIIEHNGFSCAKSSSNFSLEWYLVSFSLLSLWKHSRCNFEHLSIWPSLTSSPLHRIFQQVLLTAVVSLLAAQFILLKAEKV